MNGLFFSAFLFFCTSASIPGALAAAIQQRADTTVCKNFAVDHTTFVFSGECGAKNHKSSISLNSCIGNNDGHLVPGENFSPSCPIVAFSQGSHGELQMNTTCIDSTGHLVESKVNLANFISPTADLSFACVP
ncbi:hypothetical protein DFH06DRAFT_1194903 [Mycena polygramma]|nr:hypothetical protein DFH06DRAFT_1194903 [Mycena polygramma]